MDETCDLLRARLGHRQPPHPARSRPPGRPAWRPPSSTPSPPATSSSSRSTGSSASAWSTSRPATAPRSSRVDHEWGTPVDAERVARRPPVAEDHRRRPRRDLAPASAPTSPRSAPVKGDALLLADAVTSIGGIELRADDWGIDIGYAGTQKCLGVAPGLAPFTINDRAFERRVEKPSSWYLDLGLLGGYVGEASGSAASAPTTTPRPTAMVVSLHAGLQRIARRGPREGLGPPRRGRPPAPGRPRGDGPRALRRRGLPPARADHRPRARRRRLRRRPRATCSSATTSRSAPASGEFASTVWRIGLMGHNARPDRVALVLAALKDALAHAA